MRVAKKEKKEVILLETNLKGITDSLLPWDFAHGGGLAAVGLLLRSGIQKVYISGAVRENQLFPYGTHPLLDPLWSTETITFVHEGTEYNRLEKILHVVSKSSLAMNYLRVCNQNVKGKYNCSRCFKCLTTMIMLVCANALEKAKTFDRQIDLSAVRSMHYNYALLYNLQGEDSLRVLQENERDNDLQDAVRYSLEKSKHPTLLRRSVFFLANVDKKYNKKRVFSYVFDLNGSGDRRYIFKLLARKGYIK